MKCSILVALMIMILGSNVIPVYDVMSNLELIEGQSITEDANVFSTYTLHVNGGEILDDVKVYGNSKLKMDAGTVIDGVGLYSDGKKSDINGGSIGGSIFVGDLITSHELDITGGQIGGQIWTFNESLINITGHGFNHDFGDIRQLIESPPDSGNYVSINRTGTLTGILENGDSINAKFHILGNSNITLIED